MARPVACHAARSAHPDNLMGKNNRVETVSSMRVFSEFIRSTGVVGARYPAVSSLERLPLETHLVGSGLFVAMGQMTGVEMDIRGESSRY